MLTIKCARCKIKIMKYKKIGMGKVLRCYKDRITRLYEGEVDGDELKCGNCGTVIGQIKDDKVDMVQDHFTYSGSKIRK